MQQYRGIALLEILFVGFLLSVITVYLLRSYIVSQDKRIVTSSANTLVDTFRTAHLYGQTAKDRKAWGVISTNDTNYAMVSWDPTPDRSLPTVWTVEETNRLGSGVRFSSDFQVFYFADSGDSTGGSVSVRGRSGHEIIINVNASGIVDIQTDD